MASHRLCNEFLLILSCRLMNVTIPVVSLFFTCIPKIAMEGNPTLSHLGSTPRASAPNGTPEPNLNFSSASQAQISAYKVGNAS